MADAIKFQLNMGNGALNLAYNEIVYSNYSETIRQTKLRDLDWSVLLAMNPLAFSSFVMFRDAWDEIAEYTYGSTQDYNGTEIRSGTISASGLSTMKLFQFNYHANISGMGNGVYCYANGTLILAK